MAQGGKNPKGSENALFNDNLKDSENKQEEEEQSVVRHNTQDFQIANEEEMSFRDNCRNENPQVRLSQSVRVQRVQEGTIFQETIVDKEELNKSIDRLHDMLHDESQNIVTDEMRQLMRRIRHQSQLIQHMDKDVLENVDILWKIVFG